MAQHDKLGSRLLARELTGEPKSAACTATDVDVEPPRKKQKKGLTFDPEADIKVMGTDGKPICVVVGHLKTNPAVLIYAKKRHGMSAREGMIATYYMNSADFKAQNLKNNTVAFDSIKLLPEYYDVDRVRAKHRIMAALSKTNIPLTQADRLLKGLKGASKPLISQEESEERKEREEREQSEESEESQEAEESEEEESFDESEDLASNLKQLRATRKPQHMIEALQNKDRNTQDIHSSAINSALQSGISFMNAIENHYEDKAKLLKEKYQKEQEGFRRKLDSQLRELQLQDRLKLAEDRIEQQNSQIQCLQQTSDQQDTDTKVCGCTGQRSNYTREDHDVFQQKYDQLLKEIDILKQSQENAGPEQVNTTTMIIGGTKHEILIGKNEGFFKGPRERTTYEWDGKSWLDYRVRSRPKKLFCLDKKLEEKQVEVDGVTYREVVTENGMSRRIAMEEEVEVDDDGNEWAVSVVRNQIQVDDF